MNRKFLAITLLCSFVVIQSDSPVVKPSEEKPLVVRVVEGRRVVSETAEGKDVEARLMETRNKLDKEIKSLDKEIEKGVNDLKSRARTVDQEILEKDQEKLKELAKAREAKAEAAQGKFEKAFNRELGKFNVKIKETITELAEEKNWDVVSLKESGEIIYTSKRADATDEVIKKHDNKYKAVKTAGVAKVEPKKAVQ